MRKVSFKEWIPTKWIKKEGGNISRQVKGTGCWRKEYTPDFDTFIFYNFTTY